MGMDLCRVVSAVQCGEVKVICAPNVARSIRIICPAIKNITRHPRPAHFGQTTKLLGAVDCEQEEHLLTRILPCIPHGHNALRYFVKRGPLAVLCGEQNVGSAVGFEVDNTRLVAVSKVLYRSTSSRTYAVWHAEELSIEARHDRERMRKCFYKLSLLVHGNALEVTRVRILVEHLRLLAVELRMQFEVVWTDYRQL